MDERQVERNPNIKYFAEIKEDDDCKCTPEEECPKLYWRTGFRYKAVPSMVLVDYLTEKGFTDLDFDIDRI